MTEPEPQPSTDPVTDPVTDSSTQPVGEPEPAFIYETEVHAAPEQVWQALTSGEKTRHYWFDRRIESDWQPGSPVRFHPGESDEVTDDGEVLEYDPPRRLAYSFRNQSEPGGEPHGHVSRVAFDVEPLADGGSLLRLVHDRLASPDDVDDWQGGWMPILTGLVAMLEGSDVVSPPLAPGTYH